MPEPSRAALQFRHGAEIIRGELAVAAATAAAAESWASAVQERSSEVGLQNAAAELDDQWSEHTAEILAVLLLVWRKRYDDAGGRANLADTEWAEYSDRVQPYLADVRQTILAELETGTLTVTEISQGRAKVVSRTQTLSAYNGGAFQGFENYRVLTGRGGTKRWLSLKDSHVRETHLSADGQVVPVTLPFMVGGFAGQYPGDPSLPVWETANCRCVAIFDLL